MSTNRDLPEGWESVSISPETRALLEAHTTMGVLGDTTLQADGRYSIDLDPEVLARLRLISTDIDEAIRVVCSTGVGHA